MKRLLLLPIICILSATEGLFAQHSQSLSFTDPGLITPGSTFNVSVTLTYSGYKSFGLSYWLEANNALAPFLHITSATYFTFPDPNQPIPPGGSPFNGGQPQGASPGFMLETTDLGATRDGPCICDPGSHHITDLTFSLAPGAPLGMFTVQSTTHSPRISEVTDTDFNDNNIIPPGSFTLNIVPEPSAISLVILAIVGFGLIAYRHRKRSANKSVSNPEIKNCSAGLLVAR